MDRKERALRDMILRKKSLEVSREAIHKTSSGMMSNFYFNLKKVTLDPNGMFLVGEIVWERMLITMKGIGGLTLGADPIAISTAFIAKINGWRLQPFIVRKSPKGYGTDKWIEGNVRSGDLVTVVDDVINTGKSTITAIERAREAGLIVKSVIALVDREAGGVENIKMHVKKVECILKRSDFKI